MDWREGLTWEQRVALGDATIDDVNRRAAEIFGAFAPTAEDMKRADRERATRTLKKLAPGVLHFFLQNAVKTQIEAKHRAALGYSWDSTANPASPFYRQRQALDQKIGEIFVELDNMTGGNVLDGTAWIDRKMRDLSNYIDGLF